MVAEDVGDFQESFLEALAIVLLVSFLSLGWRTGIVVAISVPLVLAGVLVGMKLLGIDLQRISLGAMMIALGLLVDDAIIAVETMTVKLEQGWDRLRAGSFAYTSTAFPMLTGTLVTAAGYLPVGLAQSSTGEYTQDIFRVVGMALVLSLVRRGAVRALPRRRAAAGSRSPRAVHGTTCTTARLYRRFRRVVAWCVRRRWLVIGGTVAAFALSVVGFHPRAAAILPGVRPAGGPDRRAAAGGRRFAATAAEVGAARGGRWTQESGIASYAAYTGTGTPRFFLAFSPELDQPNYAQFVINTKSIADREALLAKLNALIDEGRAGGFADVRLRAVAAGARPAGRLPGAVPRHRPRPDGAAPHRRARCAARCAPRPHLRNVSDSWERWASR